MLPSFATKEGVVAIGEIGFDEQTQAEEKYFRLQLDLARELDLPVMIHTPHRDKKRGASRSMDIILEHKLAPSRVVIDHVNEETVAEVLDRGFWAGFSIYPHSKMTAPRMCEIVKTYGADRLIVDSACDWGVSDPLSVPKTAMLLAERGLRAERPDARAGLAVGGTRRPAPAVRRKYRLARWADPTRGAGAELERLPRSGSCPSPTEGAEWRCA
jgi:predicted metal-dependent TIM-barrel fold hydrolase